MSPPLDLLKSVFGYEAFRPGQEDIISAIGAGENVLAIMPTGAGKSICYQLPALARDGLTLVISPLVALMRDQVSALTQNGVIAGALTSASSPEERDAIFSGLRDKSLKLLYMAPERLETAQAMLARADVRMIAIDEAHCVSQWGHDFRPDYLKIGDLAQSLGNPQIAAFTATADTETRKDIIARLFADEPRLFLHGFDRPNLFLSFAPKLGSRSQLTGFVAARPGQSGIIYCASRKKVESLAELLAAKGVDALPYHAGLDHSVRQKNQDRFTREDGVVMVATIAFGMGVDKPDVRFVLHADLPQSVESYYQEIGRAGRDGLPADTLTLYGIDDIKLRRRQIDESEAPEERKRIDHLRLNALLSIAEAPRCRRQSLLAYFGEQSEPCGNCDLCKNPPELIDGTVPAQKALSAIARTGQRYGLEHLISVLLGDDNERVRETGHDKLPTFGVGTEFDRGQWRGVFRQLYATGLAAVDPAYGGWQATEEGWQVLRGGKQVQLRKDSLKPQLEKRPRGKKPVETLEGDDAALLRALKALRRDLAAEINAPAYVIFADRTLIEMAELRPRNMTQMAEVHGVGARKLEAFGDVFLAAVRDFENAH